MNKKQNKISSFEHYAKLLGFNPNLLIKGAPGTGKTFTAMKIVESFEKLNHKAIDFETVEKQGRVKFITFHKSYTYEHFIEGLNPAFSKNKENTGLPFENGIFKQFAISASLEILKTEIKNSLQGSVNAGSKIWKVSLGYRKTEERIYNFCKKSREIAVGWLENESLEGKSYNEIYSMLEARRGNDEPKLTSDVGSINALVNEMKKGDFVLIYDSPGTVTDIGIVTGEYFYDDLSPYPHKRKVHWFKEFQVPVDISKYDNNTRLTLKTIYELEQINFSDLREIIMETNLFKPVSPEKIKPFYLIIDEINRGNIADIFGEVISLLDKDKRDKFKCNLLYSKKSFSLPNNFYLIGTLSQDNEFFLDPVLQRRFIFINLKPNPDILKNLKFKSAHKIKSKINISRLLNNLNAKILAELGNDYLIGHAYFIGINNINDLYNAFYYKIVPLLMSYFSNNLNILISILGENFFDNKNNLKYLDIKGNNKLLSQFEIALMKI